MAEYTKQNQSQLNFHNNLNMRDATQELYTSDNAMQYKLKHISLI